MDNHGKLGLLAWSDGATLLLDIPQLEDQEAPSHSSMVSGEDNTMLASSLVLTHFWNDTLTPDPVTDMIFFSLL